MTHQAAKQRQAWIGHQGHGMALALDGPQLERQRAAQRVRRGDHPGAGQLGARGELLELQAHQIGQEQEQATTARGEPRAGLQRELAYVGHGLGDGPQMIKPLLISAARQRREALLTQQLAHRGRAQGRAVLLQGLADLVDRMVLLAQGHGQVVGLGLVRLSARTATGRVEEPRIGIAAELMAQHAEGAGGIAEGAGDFVGGDLIDEEGA